MQYFTLFYGASVILMPSYLSVLSVSIYLNIPHTYIQTYTSELKASQNDYHVKY